VRDVGGVAAILLEDERLLPDHLLHGRQLHRRPEHLGVDGVLEPFVVDGAHAVAGGEDHIDEVAVRERLPEPM
jgi:hypothetical protein